jgi:hypothetical protein
MEKVALGDYDCWGGAWRLKIALAYGTVQSQHAWSTSKGYVNHQQTRKPSSFFCLFKSSLRQSVVSPLFLQSVIPSVGQSVLFASSQSSHLSLPERCDACDVRIRMFLHADLFATSCHFLTMTVLFLQKYSRFLCRTLLILGN